MASQHYSVHDLLRGYAWLHHHDGVTEVNLLHPAYQPGDPAWNNAQDAWPITRYLRTSNELLHLVRQYAGERLICYGVNPRPAILRHPNGRLRSATETDIQRSQTLLLDIDLVGKITPERQRALHALLSKADEYCRSHGLQPPVRASTGRGYHLLFAYPPILVKQHPNIRSQLRTFKDHLTVALQHDLTQLDARMDDTTDLRRAARVYGTTKPDVGILSQFYGNQRAPDPALQDHLLSLPDQPLVQAPPPPGTLAIQGEVPEWFTTMLSNDTTLHDLWHNRGKPEGTDQTSSGYDYTIIQYLAKRGRTDPQELATILAQRSPNRSKQASYLARTIAQALSWQHPGA